MKLISYKGRDNPVRQVYKVITDEQNTVSIDGRSIFMDVDDLLTWIDLGGLGEETPIRPPDTRIKIMQFRNQQLYEVIETFKNIKELQSRYVEYMI